MALYAPIAIVGDQCNCVPLPLHGSPSSDVDLPSGFSEGDLYNPIGNYPIILVMQPVQCPEVAFLQLRTRPVERLASDVCDIHARCSNVAPT